MFSIEQHYFGLYFVRNCYWLQLWGSSIQHSFGWINNNFGKVLLDISCKFTFCQELFQKIYFFLSFGFLFSGWGCSLDYNQVAKFVILLILKPPSRSSDNIDLVTSFISDFFFFFKILYLSRLNKKKSIFSFFDRKWWQMSNSVVKMGRMI